MTTINKDWKVYRINVDTGETVKVASLAQTYEDELIHCNNLNRSVHIYRAVYYIDKNK